jgi:hypothetical protein
LKGHEVMMIQVDLTRIHDAPDLGRVAAVALLSALPVDEAQLAVHQWRVCLAAAATSDDLDNIPLAGSVEFKVDHEMAPTVIEGPGQRPQQPVRDTQQEPQAVQQIGKGTRLEDVLSAKTANALKHAGFQVLGDLETRSAGWLLSTVDRFGKGGLAEVEAAMAKAGLSLSTESGVPKAPVRQQERAGPPTPHSDDIPFNVQPKPVVPEPAQASFLGNGGAVTLRNLCRRAEEHLGRERTWALLQAVGVSKISAATAEQEAALRASIAEALA